ncbi:MAG TPA: phage terminase large subunit [Hymenobacter sp.]|jgi:predicted phage terminase large subunit-like protein
MIPSLDQIVAQACKNSFYRFLLEMWGTIEAVPFVSNWHIEYLCNELQDVYERWERGETQPDVLINVPPGTSKSTTVTQLFPAWLWLKHPPMRIISSSFTAHLSVGHAVKSRMCLRSPKFQRLFPGHIEFQEDQDGKTDYRNTKLGQRLTTSSTGAVTGNHADFIIIDDPLNPQQAASKAALETASEHLKTLATRTTDATRTVKIMVMQRIAENDPAGEWLATGEALRHICLPAELVKNAAGELGAQVRPAQLRDYYIDGLLDPVRRPRTVLAKLKLALGSYGYAGQVMQLPAPEEGGMLKKVWFRTTTWAEFQQLPGAARCIWLADADTAYTTNTKNDPSALLVSTYLGQNLYVRLAAEYWLELPALKRKLLELLPLHGFGQLSKLYIEPKANGLSVAQELRAMSQLNVVMAPAPVADKTARVHTCSPFIEAGRVVIIVDAPAAPVGWHVPFVSQCAGFPTAAHDDMLDDLTQAIARAQNVRKGTSIA